MFDANEQPEIPPILILPDSSIRLSYESGIHYYNRTKHTIFIEGTRNGFLSLANSILFVAYELLDKFAIHKFPFVSGDINLFVEFDNYFDEISCGEISDLGDSSYLLKINEKELIYNTWLIHTLGFNNPEYHMDEGKLEDDISIYCVVD